MRAMKTKFDGKSIKVPKQLKNAPPGEILIIAQEDRTEESAIWTLAQESAFAKVWENDKDAVYDTL